MNLRRTWLAVPAVLALSLAACSTSNAPAGSSSGSAQSGAASTGIVSTNGTEPQNPLIPSNTTEVGGGKIVQNLFSGLTYYDASGASHNEVAKSIETSDAQHYTVTLNQGYTFTDGTPVKAENFVNAWKAGAKNKDLGAYFYANIAGAAADGTGNLTGLKTTGDYTFTIALKAPQSDFPESLGYAAFYPLPDSTLKNRKSGGEHPVGDGPYKVDGANAWTHNQQIKLVANPDYNGPRKAKNGGITIKFYTDQTAAYNDLLSGQLDVLDNSDIPDSALSSFEKQLGDRAVNQPAAIFQSITIPEALNHFKPGKEGTLRREAISYAIDRDTITQKIFSGTRTPAKDFTSPVIKGYSGDIKGNEVLSYNPTKAKQLWAEANKISPWSGTFTIGYNSDGGHQAWVDAASNSIKNALGINAEGNPYPDFKSLLDDEAKGTVKGAYRSGWQGDYPSLYDFLAQLYATGAGSNYGKYSSKAFDALLTKASSTTDIDKANQYLNQSQEILFQDLPVIPLWYQNAVGGYSQKVSNVKFGWDSWALLYNVTKQG